MGSYISARFEVDDLSASDNGYRVIVRGVDQGAVPPKPSATYFPTQPNDYVDFIVVDYAGPSVGENFHRVATITDFSSLSVRPLNTFVDKSGTYNFTSGAIAAGDVLEVYPSETEKWVSEEYPGSPFRFVIKSIEDASTLTVYTPFPSFINTINWEITDTSGTTILSGGVDGGIRRSGIPSGGSMFLTQRFNSYFTDVASALDFKEATKAGLEALARESELLNFSPETFTAEPSV